MPDVLPWFTLFAVFIVVITRGPSWVQSWHIKRKKEKDYHRHHHANERYADIGNPFARDISSRLHALIHEIKTNNDQQERENSKRTARERLTIKVLLFTLIAVGASDFIFSYQAWVARDVERRQLRAYVGEAPVGGNVVYNPLTEEYGATSRIINSGQTPAEDVLVLAKVMPLEYPRNKNVFDDIPIIPDSSRIVSESTIFPQGWQDNHTTADGKMPWEDFIKILNSKNQRIYYWGIIYYKDEFGFFHETRFCESYYQQGDLSNLKPYDLRPDVIAAEHCPWGNDTH